MVIICVSMVVCAVFLVVRLLVICCDVVVGLFVVDWLLPRFVL